ncbi:MAG: hypothetical protein IJG52_07245 [Lachnospiraceae bacterium]|nr:hypothetical protein [Lachnospiraceae bacterium]
MDLKISDTELQEFYTDDSGAFSVGRIALQSGEDLVIEGVDEQGKRCGYFVMPAKMILESRRGTPYLARISRYMEYADEHPYSGWFSLPPLDLEADRPLLTQTLKKAMDKGDLVTVGVSEEEYPLCGFVRSLARGKVSMDLVDPSTAQEDGSCSFKVKEIEYIEYGSIDNRLLQYAFNRED